MKRRKSRPTLRSRRLAETGVPWATPYEVDRDSLLGWVVNSFDWGDYVTAPDDWYDRRVMKINLLSCLCCTGCVFRSEAAAEAWLARWPTEVEAIRKERDDHIDRYGKKAA